MLRRHTLQLARQLLAEVNACGPSTSGRIELAQHTCSWASGGSAAATACRQRWFSSAATSGAGSTAAAAAAAAAAATTGRGAPSSGLRSLKMMLHNYKQLSKFRLSMLVVATSAAGYAAGSPERIDWAGMGWTSLGTLMASSAANALNQVYERVNDGLMKRTATRPLPTGRMSPAHALAFAAATGIGGVWLLAEKTNSTTAALGAANIALYAGVYTPLKQLSVVNTWVGAVVGAVPPLMGWAAAAGYLDAGAAILGAGLYFWQLPHFMALAWMCRADYAAGGYRMLSLADATGRRTAACALRNCLYLFPLGALATWLGVTSPYFAYESAFITAGMMLTAAKFYASPSTPNARLLFRASLLHLPLFMLAFLAHRLPNTYGDRAALLAHNARLLGLGGRPLGGDSDEEEDDEEEAEEADEAAAAAAGLLDAERVAARLARVRLSLPPLPFLPALPWVDLSSTIADLRCPSKAECSDDSEGAAATAAAEDAAAVAIAAAPPQPQGVAAAATAAAAGGLGT